MKASASARPPRSMVTIVAEAAVEEPAWRGRGRGARAAPGSGPRATPGWPASRSARSRAVAQARDDRRASVATPRSASQLSNGLPVRPKVEATAAARSISARAPASRPSVRSLWPPISLVSRVGDGVGPEFDRPAEQRGERVVDDQRDAGLVRDLGQARDVGQPHQRVGERLGERPGGSPGVSAARSVSGRVASNVRWPTPNRASSRPTRATVRP